jgi:chitinase
MRSAPRRQVDDMGFDGVDIDYEPTNPGCTITAGQVKCATDAEYVQIATKLRTAMPAGQYLMSVASFHVGAYGEGQFVASKPATPYTGISLALAKSSVGQSLNLINIMA